MTLNASEFSNEIKKCYFYFFEQVVARGLGPDELGYRLLLSVVRRVILFPNENDQVILNANLEEFILGLSHARLDRQKDLLKVLLGFLPPCYQSKVINIILTMENCDSSDTFARDQSLAGKLAVAITEMEGDYQAYLSEALELQKLVEQNHQVFKSGLNDEISAKLIQRMDFVLEAIVSSEAVVPPLIKIMCKNIVDVSESETKGIGRVSGFFINRYLGGLIVKRNEAIFSKNSTGELVATCIRTYILKFLQSLATTTESDKLSNLDGPLLEALTPENRTKIVSFLKSLSQINLEHEEPVLLHTNFDWIKLSRIEQDISFKARYYTISSLLQQLNETPSPVRILTPRRSSLKLRRTQSSADATTLKNKNHISVNTTEHLKGSSILDLVTELFLYTKRNKTNLHVNCLYNDAYALCTDFISYHLVKLCRLPKTTSDDVQRGVWSPRVCLHEEYQKRDVDRVVILSNIDLYLTYISRVDQIQLGITYLLYWMNQVKFRENYGSTYKKLCESLMETAFVIDSEPKSKVFEKLMNCINDWVNLLSEKQKLIEENATLLGEFLTREKLEIEVFSALIFQKYEISIYGGESAASELNC